MACVIFLLRCRRATVLPHSPHTVPGTNNEQEVSKRKSEPCAEVEGSNLKKKQGIYWQNVPFSCLNYLFRTVQSFNHSAMQPCEYLGRTLSVAHAGFYWFDYTALCWLLSSVQSVFPLWILLFITFAFLFPYTRVKHYTKDADGLCTKLIKPKLEEGTVAAQDEFSRSKAQFICPLPFIQGNHYTLFINEMTWWGSMRLLYLYLNCIIFLCIFAHRWLGT